MVASQDSSAPLVAVIGATGNQGGSVVRYLTESSKPYRIRAIVRDPKSDKVKALPSPIELATGNLDDVESLKAAFAGADYVFGVTIASSSVSDLTQTDFWEAFSKEKEFAQGKAIVDAAKAANVKTLLWSGLPSHEELSNGQFEQVDHFEGKNNVRLYAIEQLGEQRVVSVEPASYYSNYTSGGLVPRPSPAGDGSFVYAQPGPINGKWAVLDIDEYGLWVRAAIEHRDKLQGHRIYAAAEEITNEEILDILRKQAGGKTVNYVELTPEQFRGALKGAGQPESLAIDFSEMIESVLANGYYGKFNFAEQNERLGIKPTSFAAYAAKADWSKVFA